LGRVDDGECGKANGRERDGAALAAVLGPMCADKFRSGPDATLNLAELRNTASWMQDSYIQKGGWATFPGTAAIDPAIAQECADDGAVGFRASV